MAGVLASMRVVVPMQEDRLDDVIAELSAQLEAAIEREERIAASDLAASLLQDLSLADVLVRAGHEAELPDGAWLPVTFAADDHVETGGGRAPVIVPLEVCVLRPAQVPPARRRRASLLEILRALARDKARVVIHLGRGVLEGTLSRVGRDHVIIERRAGVSICHLQRVKALEVSSPGG